MAHVSWYFVFHSRQSNRSQKHEQVSKMHLAQSSENINIQMTWAWRKIKAFWPPGNQKIRCPLAQPAVHTKEKTPIKVAE